MRRVKPLLLAALVLCAVVGAAPPARADTGIIHSSLDPSIGGQNVTFTLSPPAGITSVTFGIDYVSGGETPDTVPYHAVPVSGGVATFTHTFTTPGAHLVQALYGGPNPTSAPNLIQTVSAPSADATVTRLTVNPASSVLGTDVTAIATVTDPGNPTAIPAGDVTFESDDASIGDSQLDPAGHASVDLGNLDIGTHSVRAIYTGQAATNTAMGWLESTSDAATATVTAVPDPTDISLSTSANPVTAGQTLTLVSQVTDDSTSSRVPKGSVVFVDDGRALATAPVTGLGFARAKAKLSGQGDHLVVAEYKPTGAWVPSSSGQFDVLVLRASKISAPRACTSRLKTVPLHIVRGSHVSWVAYKIDGRPVAVSHRGPTFAVKVPVSQLHGRRHTVTAVLHYASRGRNHPVKSLTGHFQGC
jgi:hypothetical protein